ncbi:carboxymuconolactone decarboxylase family protein [Pasteurellaceae bacterium LIM206]|nr:carboxymuconolactone decarboxylase family protein [Pasteurellaceae bacterium LIM206]
MLTLKQQTLVLIGKYLATSNQAQLKILLNQSFDQHTLTLNETKDAMVQLYAYCGFPRALNALVTLMNVVEERRHLNLTTESGRTATALPDDFDNLATGKSVQTELTGKPVQGGVFDFSPDINRYLQSHLFGDIFASDLFTWQERELLTLGALGASADTAAQYQAHQNIAKYNGVTDNQIVAIEHLVQA